MNGVRVQEEPWAPCLKLRVIKAGERAEDARYLVTKKEQGGKQVGALVATKREEREDMVAPIYVGTVFHVDVDNGKRTVRVNREVVVFLEERERGVVPMTKPKGAEDWAYGYYNADELVELEEKSVQELRVAGVTGGCACVVACYACVVACKRADVDE